MKNKPAPGAEVSFLFKISGIVTRSGFGTVIGETIVGTDDAVIVRITESPDYAVGECIDVRVRNVWTVGATA